MTIMTSHICSYAQQSQLVWYWTICRAIRQVQGDFLPSGVVPWAHARKRVNVPFPLSEKGRGRHNNKLSYELPYYKEVDGSVGVM